MAPDSAPAKEPRFRVSRIVAGHEGDLADELEAAAAAGFELARDGGVISLANGDLLVISAKAKAPAGATPGPAGEGDPSRSAEGGTA